MRSAPLTRAAHRTLDATHASLIEEARRLEGEGLEARFFDLGHVGHTYAAEDPTVLRDAIVWAGGLED